MKKQSNFLIIKRINHKFPYKCKGSHIRKICSRKPQGFKVTLPNIDYRDIEYLGIFPDDFRNYDEVIERVYRTKDEVKLAKELLERGYKILAGTHSRFNDIEVLDLVNERIEKKCIIQITRGKTFVKIYSDLFKCHIFNETQKLPAFLITRNKLKKSPKAEPYDIETLINENKIFKFSKKYGTKIIGVDFSKEWVGNVADEIQETITTHEVR